jgi:hypothetical protein
MSGCLRLVTYQKKPCRRQRRHCSRVRWPRFPHVALRPHRSSHQHETTATNPASSNRTPKTFGETLKKARHPLIRLPVGDKSGCLRYKVPLGLTRIALPATSVDVLFSPRMMMFAP